MVIEGRCYYALSIYDTKRQYRDCSLPDYKWENIDGFSDEEIKYFQDYLASVAHIIMQLAREGGFEGGMDNASSF